MCICVLRGLTNLIYFFFLARVGERTDCESLLLSITSTCDTAGVQLVTVFTLFCSRCQHNAMTEALLGSVLNAAQAGLFRRVVNLGCSLVLKC